MKMHHISLRVREFERSLYVYPGLTNFCFYGKNI